MTAYTTEQIVEAMAKELALRHGERWDGTSRMNWTIMTRAALAKALELLQESTDGMDDCGNKLIRDDYGADVVWRAMIQARREELG